ncbi:MAG: PQQ-like beta-propeller repeat protein, partial [Planctomycetales bacterium]|nr:PQQ-like beta-propeller repeat protein [Planctomycetales bacterium]
DGEHEDLVALNLKDGTQKWSVKVGAVGPNRGPQYPGTRSTPSIDGNRIYTLGSNGDLICVDATTSEKQWQKNLPSDFNGKPGNWAYAESPLIDGDLLICTPGGPDATIVALNKQDGSLVWKAALPEGDDASYSSPVAATFGDRKVYVLFPSKGVVGLDAASGELLWRYTNTCDEAANVITPIVKDNLVYTGGGRVGGAAIRVSGSKSEPEELYFSRTLPTGMGGAILIGDHLYGSSGATMICVDLATGEAQWQERSIGGGSFCYADGKLFLHAEDNRVAMIKATRDGYEELGQFAPPNAPDRGRAKAWAYPIIVDGKLIIRDVGTVWCYDLRS